MHGEMCLQGADLLPSVFPRECKASWSESSGSTAYQSLLPSLGCLGQQRLGCLHSLALEEAVLHLLPSALGAMAPALLPAHMRNRGEKGKKLQEQMQFLNSPSLVLPRCCSLYPGSKSKLLLGSRRDTIPILWLQTSADNTSSIELYNGGSHNK